MNLGVELGLGFEGRLILNKMLESLFLFSLVAAIYKVGKVCEMGHLLKFSAAKIYSPQVIAVLVCILLQAFRCRGLGDFQIFKRVTHGREALRET